MLLHIVLFTFKTPYDWNSLEALEAERVTKAHPKYISEIKDWVCGRSIIERDIAADFVVMGIFENVRSLNSYIKHPNHKLGVKKWKTIAEWKVIDIDFFDNSTFYERYLSNINEV